ncbi:HAAS signaling domain-containing protein [Ornithinimicrobium panacihumi]|uniref:HAAS signaling domain-containing protein n=1 Tax=Ornithinimicrobium panacihumi TaxID=2008449 RepID=UPI003F894AFC
MLDHPLVRDYLDRLHQEATRLPAHEGRELEANIREHFAEALGPQADEATVRDTIDRLGDPAELVDAAVGARPEPGPVPGTDRPDTGAREAAAIALLLGAAVLFILWPLAIPMWIVGLVMVFTARRWTPTLKAWAGIVLGAAMPIAMVVVGFAGMTAWEQCEVTSEGVDTCADNDITTVGWVIIALLIAYLVVLAWTVVKLVRGMRLPDAR